jgi:hypothetical protein
VSVSPSSRKAWGERVWIVTFIILGFLFAVLAPWYLGLPLALIASGLGVLDGYAHRDMLGWQWVAVPAIFGTLWIVFSIVGGFRGGSGIGLLGS